MLIVVVRKVSWVSSQITLRAISIRSHVIHKVANNSLLLIWRNLGGVDSTALSEVYEPFKKYRLSYRRKLRGLCRHVLVWTTMPLHLYGGNGIHVYLNYYNEYKI